MHTITTGSGSRSSSIHYAAEEIRTPTGERVPTNGRHRWVSGVDLPWSSAWSTSMRIVPQCGRATRAAVHLNAASGKAIVGNHSRSHVEKGLVERGATVGGRCQRTSDPSSGSLALTRVVARGSEVLPARTRRRRRVRRHRRDAVARPKGRRLAAVSHGSKRGMPNSRCGVMSARSRGDRWGPWQSAAPAPGTRQPYVVAAGVVDRHPR